MDNRYKQVLGLEEYKPKEEFVCFLPWSSEFGWYIMNFVKRVHGYNHDNKIVCIKKGHECLFPTAKHFFYDWDDYLSDENKSGIVQYKHNDAIINKIIELYGDNIKFLYPQETSWDEKKSLAHITFIPEPKHDFGLDVDIVITPRLRKIERVRNYTKWQELANLLTKHGWSVGVCGKEGYTYRIKGAKYHAFNYVDVDSDIEMMLKSKVVISQETGLAYLAMMCKKPLYIMDRCHKHIADLHRDKDVFFKQFLPGWSDPVNMVLEIKRFMRGKAVPD